MIMVYIRHTYDDFLTTFAYVIFGEDSFRGCEIEQI